MAKRRDIIKTINKAAKAAENTAWEVAREGSGHTIYQLSNPTVTVMVPIPRHNEIPNNTTIAIYKECEPVLGEDWWK